MLANEKIYQHYCWENPNEYYLQGFEYLVEFREEYKKELQKRIEEEEVKLNEKLKTNEFLQKVKEEFQKENYQYAYYKFNKSIKKHEDYLQFKSRYQSENNGLRYELKVAYNRAKKEFSKDLISIKCKLDSFRERLFKLNHALQSLPAFAKHKDIDFIYSFSDNLDKIAASFSMIIKVNDITMNYYKHKIRGGYFRIDFSKSWTKDIYFARDTFTPYEINKIQHPHVSQNKAGNWGNCCFGSGDIANFIYSYFLKFEYSEKNPIESEEEVELLIATLEHYLTIYSLVGKPYYTLSNISIGVKKPVDIPNVTLSESVIKNLIKSITLIYSEHKGKGKFTVKDDEILEQELINKYPLLTCYRDDNNKYYSKDSFLSKREIEQITSQHNGSKTKIYFKGELKTIKLINDDEQSNYEQTEYINPYFKQRGISKINSYIRKKATNYFNTILPQTKNTDTISTTEQDLVHL